MRELLQLRRIENVINKIICPKIDMSDIENDEFGSNIHLYSRALAALAIMRSTDVEADIAAKSVTDGYNDMGIDAVYNDVDQRKLVLVQSKWRCGASGGIDQAEMLPFVQGVKSIIEYKMEGCNKKLIAKKPEIESALNDINYKIEVVFCHTGNQRCSDYVKNPMLKLLDEMNVDGNETLSFYELTISEVYNYLATGNGEVDITIDDVLVENWGCIEKPIRAYYGIVSADVLGMWYIKYGNKLFDKNIRYYKGSTEVNNGIQDVLQYESDKFFYYNNGVKILCKKIDRKLIGGNDNKAGLFHLEGVSLVNGAQTTGSIGAVYQYNPSLVANAKILIQMIDLRDEDASSAKQITRLTNTQNRIDSKDFAALDPQQERIKEELLFDNIQYFYKSGAVVSDADHQILFDEAIVAQACASGDVSLVHLAKQNVGALTEDIAKRPYIVLFNASTNSRALVNNVRIMRLVEKFLQNKQKSAEGRLKHILIQGNRVVLYLVLNKIKDECTNYNSELIDFTETERDINLLCEDFVTRLDTLIAQGHFNCPTITVFKSPRRIKELIATIDGLGQHVNSGTRFEDGDTQMKLALDFYA